MYTSAYERFTQASHRMVGGSAMKLRKLWFVTAASMLAFSLQPQAGWATRMVGASITGEITASPSSAQIEVAHRVYRIKANSPAEKAARSFYLGQVVDIILDLPGANSEPEVVSIAPHSGA